jgi:predicted DsbA family dithiol-disulfide isomerase
MYADLACPFAYVIHGYWQRLREDYDGRIALRHRSLALEYVNREPTPKGTLDVELPLLLASETDIPYAPWQAPDVEWPVSIWPAFEAVTCAGLQSLSLADNLAWRIRVAFFSEHKCISMRHVLLQLADTCGLDRAQFEADFDKGRGKQQVIDEARGGWEKLRLPGSPTWLLPSGEVVADFGLPEIEVDDRLRPSITKSGKSPLDRLAQIRSILDRA